MDNHKEKIKYEFEQLFRVNLNGQYEEFEYSLEMIRNELRDMSNDEIKALRTHLKKKLYSTD